MEKGKYHKNLFLINLNNFIGGFLFFLPILALYLQKELASLSNVALVLSVQAIAFAIFEVPTGAYADLYGRKKSLILSNILMLLSIIFLAIGGNIYMILLYAVINSLGRSFSSGSDLSIFYDSLKREGKEHEFKKRISFSFALWPIGASIGAIIGGIMGSYSLALPIYASLVPLTIHLFLLFFIKVSRLLAIKNYRLKPDFLTNGKAGQAFFTEGKGENGGRFF